MTTLNMIYKRWALPLVAATAIVIALLVYFAFFIQTPLPDAVYPIWIDRTSHRSARVGVIDRAGRTVVEPTFPKVAAPLMDEWGHNIGDESLLLLNESEWVFVTSSQVTRFKPKSWYRLEKFEAWACGDGLFDFCNYEELFDDDPRDNHPDFFFDAKDLWKPPEGYAIYGSLSDDLVPVQLDDRFGFANRQGRIVIPAKFDNCGSFQHGVAEVQANGLWGYIDTKGDWVIPPEFVSRGAVRERQVFNQRTDGSMIEFTIGPDGSVRERKCICFPGTHSDPVTGRYGLVDSQGRWLIKPEFDFLNPFREGLAVARIDEYGYHWAYVDEAGTVVLNFKNAHRLFPFYKGLAWIETRERQGYIDRRNRWVWSCKR